MTPQLQILTGMLCWPKDGKWNNINPFYEASREQVEQRFEFAKKVYFDIFKYGFVSSWCSNEALRLGILKDNSLKELGTKQDEIVSAIKDNRIPPIPNYRELCELKI